MIEVEQELASIAIGEAIAGAAARGVGAAQVRTVRTVHSVDENIGDTDSKERIVVVNICGSSIVGRHCMFEVVRLESRRGHDLLLSLLIPLALHLQASQVVIVVVVVDAVVIVVVVV